MAGYDWGVGPLGAIRPPTPLSNIDLLPDPPRNHDILVIPEGVYEQAPAEVMQILERLGRAGQIEWRHTDRTYLVALGRLNQEHLVVLANWWKLEQQRRKHTNPGSVTSPAVTGAPVFATHAFRPAPKLDTAPPLRLMSDPPATIIEL